MIRVRDQRLDIERTLVSRHEIIGISDFDQRKKKIVGRIA